MRISQFRDNWPRTRRDNSVDSAAQSCNVLGNSRQFYLVTINRRFKLYQFSEDRITFVSRPTERTDALIPLPTPVMGCSGAALDQ
jgi:hypothetical protein